jgi:hypothetical protein
MDAVGLLGKLEFPNKINFFKESFSFFKGYEMIERIEDRFNQEFFATIFSFCTQNESILMYDIADIMVENIFD